MMRMTENKDTAAGMDEGDSGLLTGDQKKKTIEPDDGKFMVDMNQYIHEKDEKSYDADSSPESVRTKAKSKTNHENKPK